MLVLVPQNITSLSTEAICHTNTQEYLTLNGYIFVQPVPDVLVFSNVATKIESIGLPSVALAINVCPSII